MSLKIIIDNRETNLYNNMIERDLDKYDIQITKPLFMLCYKVNLSICYATN